MCDTGMKLVPSTVRPSYREEMRLAKNGTGIQNTKDVPRVSTPILSEHELRASALETGTITSGINLNPKQPVTEDKGIYTGKMTNDSQSSTMCEYTTSMCIESIYEDDSKYRLSSNDGFKIVTN
jgi:hypothetical protein